MSSPSCSICHEIYIESDDIVTTPCRHIYHHRCLRQWFNQSENGSLCPECRKFCYGSQLQPIYLGFTKSEHTNQTEKKRKRKKKNKREASIQNDITPISSPRCAPNPEPISIQNVDIAVRVLSFEIGLDIRRGRWLPILVILSLIVLILLMNIHVVIGFLQLLLVVLIVSAVACSSRTNTQN